MSCSKSLDCNVTTSMRAHSVRVVHADDHYATLSNSGGGRQRDATKNGTGSAGYVTKDKYQREFDEFWSNPEAKRRPIAARNFIATSVCPKLYGMLVIKVALLITLIGGSSPSRQQESSSTTCAEEHDENDQHSVQCSNQQQQLSVYGDCDNNDSTPEQFCLGSANEKAKHNENDKDPRKRNQSSREKGNISESTTYHPKKKQARTIQSKRRAQSHILLIGDPGTGK
eukprot:4159836-Ditylum_brightwellii.AAC.1